jgi:hypothetical protein
MNAHFETYESNVTKEEIISHPLESIEPKIDKFIIITKSKSWCFHGFIKPNPFNFFLLILLLKLITRCILNFESKP